MKTPRQVVFGLDESQGAFRTMLLSLLASLGILIGGMVWTWHVGLETNQLDHQLSHAQEAVQDLQRSAPHSKVGKL